MGADAGFGFFSTMPCVAERVRFCRRLKKRLRIRLTLRSQEPAWPRTDKMASPSKDQAAEGLATSYGSVRSRAKEAKTPRLGFEPRT